MGKLWAVAAGAAVVTMVMAIVASEDPVHFDNTSQNCTLDEASVVDECLGLFTAAVSVPAPDSFSGTPEEYQCKLILDTVACIETALCHCNFSGDHLVLSSGYYWKSYLVALYNNYSFCGNATLREEEFIKSDVLGPVSVTGGVNCTQFNRTALDLVPTFSTMNDPWVLSLEESCEGIRSCYSVWDNAAAQALYHKQLHDLCTNAGYFMECLVGAICACNQIKNETMTAWINVERVGLRALCTLVPEVPALDREDISCAVHFDNTHQICSHNETSVVEDCARLFNEAAYDLTPPSSFPGTRREYLCKLFLDTVACTETALCHCNFSSDHPVVSSGYYQNAYLIALYNNYTYCGNATLREESGIESDILGPVLVTSGVNCTQYNRTTWDLAPTISDPRMPNLEESCEGIQSCFNDWFDAAAQALYQKQLHDLCTSAGYFIECLVGTVCACNQTTNETMIRLIQMQRYELRFLCELVPKVPALHREDIPCADSIQPDLMEQCMDFKDCVNASRDKLDSALADKNYGQFCLEKTKLIGCTDEAFCTCKLNGTYNAEYYKRTQLSYYRNHCEGYPAVEPQTCAALHLEADLKKCDAVEDCVKDFNKKRDVALADKDTAQYCSEKSKLTGCLDKAFCKCNLNGTTNANKYRNKQASYILKYCEGHEPPERKTCEEFTGTGAYLSCSVFLLSILSFLSAVTVT